MFICHYLVNAKSNYYIIVCKIAIDNLAFKISNMNVKLNVILGFSQFDRLKAIFAFQNNFRRFKP